MAKRRSFKKPLADAKAELKDLYRQREQLERKIARARQGVIALSRMCDPDPEGPRPLMRALVEGAPMGLTDAIRTVLLASETPLDQIGIRDRLESVGYDIGASPNTLISIHTILKRLVANGEVKHVGKVAPPNKDGIRWEDDAFWWGEHSIPKGWKVFTGDFTRQQIKTWMRNKKRFDDARAKERGLELRALRGEGEEE